MTYIYFSEARSSICRRRKKIGRKSISLQPLSVPYLKPVEKHHYTHLLRTILKGEWFLSVLCLYLVIKSSSYRIIFQFSSPSKGGKYLHCEMFPVEQIKTYSMFLPSILHLRIKIFLKHLSATLKLKAYSSSTKAVYHSSFRVPKEEIFIRQKNIL
jgi:hypothetical protein